MNTKKGAFSAKQDKKTGAVKLKRKQNKQPTQYNPKGVRVMILREGKIKWGWKI